MRVSKVFIVALLAFCALGVVHAVEPAEAADDDVPDADLSAIDGAVDNDAPDNSDGSGSDGSGSDESGSGSQTGVDEDDGSTDGDDDDATGSATGGDETGSATAGEDEDNDADEEDASNDATGATGGDETGSATAGEATGSATGGDNVDYHAKYDADEKKIHSLEEQLAEVKDEEASGDAEESDKLETSEHPKIRGSATSGKEQTAALHKAIVDKGEQVVEKVKSGGKKAYAWLKEKAAGAMKKVKELNKGL